MVTFTGTELLGYSGIQIINPVTEEAEYEAILQHQQIISNRQLKYNLELWKHLVYSQIWS